MRALKVTTASLYLTLYSMGNQWRDCRLQCRSDVVSDASAGDDPGQSILDTLHTGYILLDNVDIIFSDFISVNIVVRMRSMYFRLPKWYLCSLINDYRPSRSLRSSDLQLLTVPRSKSVFSSHGFRITAPLIWNSLPDNVRKSEEIGAFRSRLKTTLCRPSIASHVIPPRL